jgi:hypothetical protein
MSNQELAQLLAQRFPWLGTDEDANGADVIDALNEWYEELQGGAE